MAFVYSSHWWTSEFVYSNDQLYDVMLGFPVPYMSVDYVGSYDISQPIFKLPADIGIGYSFQSTTWLPILFWLDVIIVYVVFWLVTLGLKRYVSPIKLVGGVWIFLLVFFLINFVVSPLIKSLDTESRLNNDGMWQSVDVSSPDNIQKR